MARRALAALLVVGLTACGQPTPPPAATVPASAPEPDASAPVPREWDPWEDARTRGIEFRAVGQEPGWYLEIDNERWMRLLYAYAERSATTPVPSPIQPGQPTTLDASADGHRLRVSIVVRECLDAMSGESFPATVTVTIDGTGLQGCGRWLAPETPRTGAP